MKFIRIGRIVNTHGIKGELKIISDFKYKDRIFKNGFPIYIGKEKNKEIINTYRVHKSFDMITLIGYTNINEVLKYKGDYVFINGDDLILAKEEFLDEDLIGFNVIYNGIPNLSVIGIEKYPSSKMLKVKTDDKYKLIPLSNGIIDNIDLEKKEILIKDIEGLI
ncbi:MAG: ribosome maturation factor RimM [Bacilli bacterium]|nr:ribosome maturation factor RimM [Bacilli bacterium]